MNQDKSIALTSNSLPAIPDAKALAALRMDKSVPHYKDIEQTQRVQWLSKEIMTLNMIRHQTVEGWQIGFDSKALDEFIMDDTFASDYTLSEIRDAFKRGMMGDYGDYYGLTAESLYGFIRGYFMSAKKREATEIVRKSLRKENDRGKGEFYLEKVRRHAEMIANKMRINNTDRK